MRRIQVTHAARAALLALTAAVLVTGCGGGDGGSGAAPASNKLVLSAAAPPSAEQCGFKELGGQANATGAGRGATVPPPRGVYRYETKGSESIPGQGTGSTPLSPKTQSLVTPVRRSGRLSCFGVEHRYSPTTARSNVYLTRGDDTYIVGVGFSSAHYVQKVLPRPAILAVAGSGTHWAGTFRGATSGTYRVEIVGRRTFQIDGRSVKAVGLSSRATYTGEASGSQQTDTWLATDRSLVLLESGQSKLRFGGDEERLKYTTRLLSLKPGAGG